MHERTPFLRAQKVKVVVVAKAVGERAGKVTSTAVMAMQVLTQRAPSFAIGTVGHSGETMMRLAKSRSIRGVSALPLTRFSLLVNPTGTWS